MRLAQLKACSAKREERLACLQRYNYFLNTLDNSLANEALQIGPTTMRNSHFEGCCFWMPETCRALSACYCTAAFDNVPRLEYASSASLLELKWTELLEAREPLWTP